MQFLNQPFNFVALAVSLFVFLSLLASICGKRCRHDWSAAFFILPCLSLLAAVLINGSSSSIYSSSLFVFGEEFLLQKIDPLSGIFLFYLSIIGICSAIFSPKYLAHFGDRLHSGQYWTFLPVFMISMSMVILSANAVTFMVFWEIMSLSSLVLVASDHQLERNRAAAFIYLAATRIASAFLAAGFIIAYSQFHSWNFDSWSFTTSLAPFLIAIGLFIKAGVFPFHLWLPYAHTAAPSPISALMSGIMIKIAIYAVIRLLVVGNLDSLPLAYVILTLGLLSSFWGLMFGLIQQDLKRLLAYSSIENVGLILCAIGAALIARHNHLNEIAVLALTAALFHCINHCVFKSLLFLSVGSIDVSTGTRDLSLLGGLQKTMPWTSSCFLIGSFAICALPPLNGFASKWLLYQSFFHQCWQSPVLIQRATALISIGILALVGGMALMCFARAIGISLLGNSRSHAVSVRAHETSKAMILAQFILAALTIAMGLAAPFICTVLQEISAALLHVKAPASSFFMLPLSQLTLLTLITSASVYFTLMRNSQIRKYITWDCGFGAAMTRSQVTAISFSQPIARIFAPLLRFKLQIEISGSDRRHFPEQIKVEPQTASLLETRIYLPTVSWIQHLSALFAKIQAGSIHLYLLYLCLSLILLMLVGTQL